MILRSLFTWLLLLSVLAHASAWWYFRSDFEEPRLIPPREGRASVYLRPAPKPVQPKEEPVEAPMPVAETLPLPRETPETLPLPREAPEETPEEPQPEAPKEVKQPEQQAQAAPRSDPTEGAILEARELWNPAPIYPPEALAAGHQGTVWLHLHVDATGVVTRARLYESSGYSSLDASALRTARVWRFYPARRNGVAIPREILKPVIFTIRASR